MTPFHHNADNGFCEMSYEIMKPISKFVCRICIFGNLIMKLNTVCIRLLCIVIENKNILLSWLKYIKKVDRAPHGAIFIPISLYLVS